MSESILNALVQLFAIIANVDEDGVSTKAKRIVKSYLKQHLTKELVEEYIDLFDQYWEFHHRDLPDTGDPKGLALVARQNKAKVTRIAAKINQELHQREKVIVFLRLLEFIFEDDHVEVLELAFVNDVAAAFNISEQEAADMSAFVLRADVEGIDPRQVLTIDSTEPEDDGAAGAWFEENQPERPQGKKHIYKAGMRGKLVVLQIKSINTYVLRYLGNGILYLKGINVLPEKCYFLDHGAIVRGPKLKPVYFGDIVSKFLEGKARTRVVFKAEEVEFRFKNSENGLYKFNFTEESGNLVGIMGGSGVGKSTLLNVFNGQLPPKGGRITINGYDLHLEADKLEGVIGFVPQDDLLIEELTVYENLYYNAKLCFSHYTERQIIRTVSRVLSDLDLNDVRGLRVGNPLKKYISGGQRKRLNIALELMREPSVLFVDEPTSGLSSMDSETVMLLLKQQASKGKIVVVNIHQPSSEIFKLIDRLIILDKGGRPIYNGNPIDGIVYFKKMTSHVNADEAECPACGNVNAERILQIVEAKRVDEYGRFTRDRVIKPDEWYKMYRRQLDSADPIGPTKEKLPTNNFKIPDRFRQFKIFTIRNVLSKLTNRQYLLINLLEAPGLAFILGYFTKYMSQGQYIFSENKNLPVFLFMSIVVALFMGLTVSAEEIIKDRRILKREAFLNLSWAAYVNSKLVVLFALSAVQSLLFVLVGSYILEIRGMTWEYWLILYTSAAFSNLIGLNISSGLNSVVNIYILIPFILVPQLLLGGAMVSFDELHDSIRNDRYVPIAGDLMPSRWAYEALAVTQFKENDYQRIFFPYEMGISQASYHSAFLFPALRAKVEQANFALAKGDADALADALRPARPHFKDLARLHPQVPAPHDDSLTVEAFSTATARLALGFLDSIAPIYQQREKHFRAAKDSAIRDAVERLGQDILVQLRRDHENKALADFVLNKRILDKAVETRRGFVQRKDPAYHLPEHPLGRSHFYAPAKLFMGQYIDTFWFNLAVIWLGTFLLYLALLGELLKKALGYLESQQYVKSEKRSQNPVLAPTFKAQLLARWNAAKGQALKGRKNP